MRAVSAFDRIFVHSDPGVVPLDVGGPMPDVLAARLEYTGYVTPSEDGPCAREGHVLVHAGGGRDGGVFWRAVDRLERHAESVRFIRCGQDPEALADGHTTLRLLRSAWRSVSMGGYNTVAEWLAFRTPTIFMPRRSDPEQATRLRRLRDHVGGPMAIADPTPEGLLAAWAGLRDDAPVRGSVWVNGQALFAEAVRRALH